MEVTKGFIARCLAIAEVRAVFVALTHMAPSLPQELH